jgi:hypothetical protein
MQSEQRFLACKELLKQYAIFQEIFIKAHVNPQISYFPYKAFLGTMEKMSSDLTFSISSVCGQNANKV